MTLHVAAALIEDSQGRVLLAQRRPGDPLQGLWEFPGGKIESGETSQHALVRELHEELGVHASRLTPVRSIRWPRIDDDLLLELWRAEGLDGEPFGREGQRVTWFERGALRNLPMPPADYPLLDALLLPDRYWITPDLGEESFSTVERGLFSALDAGVCLLQLRLKSWSDSARARMCEAVLTRVQEHGATLLINDCVTLSSLFPETGLHLSSTMLASLAGRPLPRPRWLAASCHDLAELKAAEAIGCDFACLSPVRETRSHPGGAAMGWLRFEELAGQTWLPLYALGGMRRDQVAVAKAHGAVGIAGIRGVV